LPTLGVAREPLVDGLITAVPSSYR